MFKVHEVFDKETYYRCDDAEDVSSVVLKITKSQEDAEHALTIAKLMKPNDCFICFDKYVIER